MGSVNKVILVGNLGRDAEVRYTPGGAAVADLSLATTESWNDRGGEKQEKTEWHRIVLWGKQAESLAEYLKKGKQVYIEGRLQTREWKDKDDQKRFTTEVKADRVTLLGGNGNGSAMGSSRGDDDFERQPRQAQSRRPARTERDGNRRTAREVPMPDVTDDDIPFSWVLPLLMAGFSALFAA